MPMLIWKDCSCILSRRPWFSKGSWIFKKKIAHKPVYLFWLNKLEAAFPKYRGDFPLMVSRTICSFTDRVDGA